MDVAVCGRIGRWCALAQPGLAIAPGLGSDTAPKCLVITEPECALVRFGTESELRIPLGMGEAWVGAGRPVARVSHW